MAVRIFLILIILTIFAAAIWMSPPGAPTAAATAVDDWLASFTQVGLPMSTLIEINATGLGILSAGVILRFSPMGQDFDTPADASTSDRMAWALGARTTAFRAMVIFGGFCLLSTLAILMLDRPAVGDTDQSIALIATQLTALGMLLAVVWVMSRWIRLWVVVHT